MTLSRPREEGSRAAADSRADEALAEEASDELVSESEEDESAAARMAPELLAVLEEAVGQNASDAHLVPGRPSFLRVNGELQRYGTDRLSSADIRRLLYSVISVRAQRRFEREGELDASFAVKGLGRFRLNLYREQNGMGAVLRVIPYEIPSPEELGIGTELQRITDMPRGLVLVTGPTGSGKSTTLASLINRVNLSRRLHILTMEDPIEYVFPSGSCVVTQREVGSHTRSFAESLRRGMRQDPDVILVGEMRDLETIAATLTLVETGHLVFATLHTTDAAQSVDRIIDVFPPFQQQQVRTQLASVLRVVICQQLLPRADGLGRVAAREVMVVNPGIANLIREGKTHQIYSAIELGARTGMISLDRHLFELVRRGTLLRHDAVAKAVNPAGLLALLDQKDER
jgi:twitching motility protein PilT